jgi:hypothetical protein
MCRSGAPANALDAVSVEERFSDVVVIADG